MQTRTNLLPLLAVLLGALTASVSAQEQASAPAAAGSALQLDKYVVQSTAAPTANTLAGPQQIRLQSQSSSVINVIKFLPGVNLSQGDSIGSDDWSTRITIRGFSESQLGFTVDGIPTGFTGYAGGTKPNRYVDLENLSRVIVSQGAGDIASASSQALGGTLAYFTESPAAMPGATADFTTGSFNNNRAFFRVDTGRLGNHQAFASFSAGQSDNWVGDFVGGSAAVTKHLHGALKDEGRFGTTKFTAYASLDGVNPEINYQGVSKQQFAQDPRNDQLTFHWTGNPDIDQNYAATWTTIRTNSLVYFKTETPLSDSLRLTFQPYWHHMNGRGEFLPPYQIRRYDLAGNLAATGDYVPANQPGRIYYADANGKDLAPVNPATGAILSNSAADSIASYTWLTPAQQAAAHRISSARYSRYLNNRFGDNLALAWDLAPNNHLQFGMWNEVQERERHRTWHNVLNPLVSPAFDQVAYNDQFHWNYRTTTAMFYVQDQYTLDKLTFTAGLKYYGVKLTDHETFLLPTGAPNFGTSLTSNSNVLPSLGAQYKLDEYSELFASYSSNFSAVPDALLEAGASGVDLSKVKPEKAANIDFGYRYSGRSNVALSLTGYYIKYTDKLVALSGLAAKDYTNASSGVWTNIGGTESYGIEAALNYRLGEGFSVLSSLSTTKATYTASTPDGTIIAGKRVVDTPDLIFSYGLLYNRGGIEAGLLGKYTGKRYGTYSNDNSADAYNVLDLNLGYTRTFGDQGFIKSLRIGLSITNLLDKNYLSSVSVNDQGYVKNDPAGDTMLWNIGAPRTYAFTVGLGF